jgi:hypothetical protein
LGGTEEGESKIVIPLEGFADLVIIRKRLSHPSAVSRAEWEDLEEMAYVLTIGKGTKFRAHPPLEPITKTNSPPKNPLMDLYWSINNQQRDDALKNADAALALYGPPPKLD